MVVHKVLGTIFVMVKNYMKLLAANHHGVSASCDGDASVYANIIWDGPSVQKSVLDDEYLPFLKKEKNMMVDKRTNELIDVGFVYNGNVFSLSAEAQMNWVALKQADTLGFITYPVGISTKDDREHILVDTVGLVAFYVVGLATIKTAIDSGRILKVLINDAVDEMAVASIQDTRV